MPLRSTALKTGIVVSTAAPLPLAAPFLLALFLALIVLVALLELRVLRYAYERMGIDSRHEASTRVRGPDHVSWLWIR